MSLENFPDYTSAQATIEHARLDRAAYVGDLIASAGEPLSRSLRKVTAVFLGTHAEEPAQPPRRIVSHQHAAGDD